MPTSGSDDLFEFDVNIPSSLRAILVAGFIIQMMSILACMIILIISFIMRFHKDQVGKMMIIITFMQIGHALPLTQLVSGSFFCYIADMITCYCLVSVCVWSACLTHHLMAVLFYERINPKRLFRKYLLIAQGIPCVFSALSMYLQFNSWDESENTCLHTSSSEDFDITLLITRILPVFLALTLALIFYSLCLKKLREVQQLIKKTNQDGTTTILFLIPLINLIIWAPMLILLILLAIGVDVNETVANAIYLVTSGQGLINSIAFGCSGKLKAAFRKQKAVPLLSDTDIESSWAWETVFKIQKFSSVFQVPLCKIRKENSHFACNLMISALWMIWNKISKNIMDRKYDNSFKLSILRGRILLGFCVEISVLSTCFGLLIMINYCHNFYKDSMKIVNLRLFDQINYSSLNDKLGYRLKLPENL